MNAGFEVPLEPVGEYETMLSRDTYQYGENCPHYDPEYCFRICHEITKKNEGGSDAAGGPFKNGAFPVCTFFVAFELRKGKEPVGMVCGSYSSVWSSHYQSLRGVEDMLIFRVAAYAREDYQYPPICVLEEHCKGDEYYAGGDCGGWGQGKCQVGGGD